MNRPKETQATVAIDCGANGAIVVCKGRSIEIHRMPVFHQTDRRGKNRYHTDLNKLREILQPYAGDRLCIEQITTYQGDYDNRGRAIQMQKLHTNYIEIRTVAQSLGYEIEQVMPRIWQKYLGFVKVYISSAKKRL